MLIDDTPITLEALCYALLCTAETSQVLTALHSTLHTTTILLKQTEKDVMECKTIETIMEKVQEKLKTPLCQLSKAVISLEADTLALHSQLDDLESLTIKQAISNIESMVAKVETSSTMLANMATSYMDALLHTASSAPID